MLRLYHIKNANSLQFILQLLQFSPLCDIVVSYEGKALLIITVKKHKIANCERCEKMNILFDKCTKALDYASKTKTYGVFYSEKTDADTNVHVHECCEIFLNIKHLLMNYYQK